MDEMSAGMFLDWDLAAAFCGLSFERATDGGKWGGGGSKCC